MATVAPPWSPSRYRGRPVVSVVALWSYCGGAVALLWSSCCHCDHCGGTVVTVVMLCVLRFRCSGTVVIVGILLVVARWWHCDDTVVSVVVTVIIMVALWSLWWHCGHCGDTVFIAVALQ